MKRKLQVILCLVLCLIMAMSFAACKKEGKSKKAQTSGEKALYTVRILNQNDSPMAGIGVYIYENNPKGELVWYDATNEAGEITFEDIRKDCYVAVLADVPVGYEVAETYPLTGLVTEIKLAAGTMTGEEDIVYNLGDLVMDFTITDTDGVDWTLTEMLKQKDAVVLNFYYNECEPCKKEFPGLQEAYLEYEESIGLIAMNPVNDNDAVAQFKLENGYTFPMAAVLPNWENIMQIQGYPTTVVIDRFGNIVLMHTGGIDEAKRFKDVFAAVSGEDYEQVIFQSLDEVPISAKEGSIDNPALMGATPKFELTIEGGQEHYIEFLKVNNLTMRIEDPDIYVIYNKKTYTPKNGVVSLLLNCPDMNTPILVGFGNSAKETKTFVVTMTAQPGTINNPYDLKLGDNKVRVNAGNSQGVYYIWTAKANGSLRAWCISATAGVKYDCTLYNLNSYAQRNLSSDGKQGEDAQLYVEVKVNKGDKVQMIAAVLPDENWNYPAGNFIYMVEFLEGDGRDTDKEDLTTYTVTVTDDKNKPISNVNFSTEVKKPVEEKTPDTNETTGQNPEENPGEGEQTQVEVKTFASNAEGIAKIDLPTGEYLIKLTVPDGYTSEVTEFTLTKEKPDYKLVLKEKVIVMVDYTVTVTDPEGAPLSDVVVVIGDQFAVTGEDGNAVINLEQGEYPVVITPPAGYVVPEGEYAFGADQSTMTVALAYAPGTENNPISIEELTYTTDPIASGTGMYYALYRKAGMILKVSDPDVELVVDGKTYTPDANGEIALVVPASGGTVNPVIMQVINKGAAAKSFTITLEYPLGHIMNPQALTELGTMTTSLAAGDADGYYYTWTAAEEGFVAFYVSSATEGVVTDIVLTNTVNSACRSLMEDGSNGVVTLNVAAGDTITIQVMTASQDADGRPLDHPAAQIVTVGSFTAQENTEDAKILYSVVVQDDAGNAMSGVAVKIGNNELNTDETGTASVRLVEGEYDAVVTVPEGYKSQNTQFKLTILEPRANVVLTKLQNVAYTVNVQLNGAAYTGNVTVQFLQGTTVVYEQATATGTVTTSLLEGTYTINLLLGDDSLGFDATNAQVTTDAPVLTISLEKLTTETEYEITVLDANSAPLSGVMVQFMSGTQSVAAGVTDAKGQCVKTLTTAEYMIKLSFSGTSYYYNTQTAKVTGVAPKLTIRLAAEVDPSNVMSHWIINDNNMFKLGEGSTHIQVSAGKPYFTSEMGYNDCLFVFEPTRPGMFRISIDRPDVELRNYGSSPYFLFVADSASNHEDNALPFELKQQEQVGSVFMFLGVEVVEGITDMCITITRVGEPGFDISAQPWSTDWQTGYKPVQQTVTVPSGQSLKYVDIKAATNAYTIVYNQKDGFYHVGSVDGPVLYLNLGTVTKQNISINEIINGTAEGAGGSPIRRYFYDENGTFIKKEDYTETLLGYIAKADPKYGLYPITDELAYILQNAKPGWWDVSHPDYLLTDCNPELGWLFAACYIQ